MINTVQRIWRREPILRLTTACVAILIVFCALFSSVLYNIASREIEGVFGPRPERPGIVRWFETPEDYRQWKYERVQSAHNTLILELILFNAIMISVGGIASYFFAKRTFRPIERALTSQTQFSSDAAHELRTPLTVMQSEIDVALRSNNSKKQNLKETLISNREEVLHMRDLTDRLLALASNDPIEKERTKTSQIITSAQPRLQALCKKKQIKLELSINDAVVLADNNSIQDVLTILVENAVKYSKYRSKIIISSNKNTINVTDNGIGIAPEHHKLIFDRLYRVDKARSKQDGGSGLGLSLAKRIMERHGGQIIVKSTPKKGSTFTVCL